MSHMTAGRRKAPMGLLRSTHQNRRKTQKAFTPKERQRLQRMKADAFRQLDKQIRREQMAIVQRIRYLESIPARDHFAQDHMAVDQDEDESDDEIFQDLLEDICAIDIGGDDYAEILEFEVQADTNGVWEETIAGLGDLF
ncbi:hypothetical protein HDU85_006163 [Gaertneriomyces sp. JEL0708]|nr:hypothetical protein HDU85_006163 [Gaertneriomyces sp. JEL0708]